MPTSENLGRPARVVAIAATGQSGATILTRMLGQLPGFTAIGEVGRLFDKGMADNTACGCGAPFLDCPFWAAVGDRAFDGWGNVDVDKALWARKYLERRRRHLTQLRALPFQLRPSLSREYALAERHYCALLGRIYGAIRDESSGAVIVDSMKESWHVFALTRVPQIDLRVIHQVRDSRGVAYSSTRRVERQGGAPGTYRGQFPPLKTGARWMWTNLAFEVLACTGAPSMLAPYEELIDNPRYQLQRITAFAGQSLTQSDLRFLRNGSADLPPDHIVAGNRVRLHSGPTPLRRDEEWRTELSRRDRFAVSALTWPLRRRYAPRSVPIDGSGRS